MRTCSWRPGDAEALPIALSIPVTSAALAALNREMALLQTYYPTGVYFAQRHLDAIADLDQQLAALSPSARHHPAAARLPLHHTRSCRDASAGASCLPSTPLPAGEWIYLPARRSAPSSEEVVESLG